MIDCGLRCTHANPQYAYIAPTYSQAKRIAWDLLKEYLKDIPNVEFNESELRADIYRPHLKDKVRIILLGAENPGALRGLYLDGTVLDEYAEMNPEVWSQVIRPALSDRGGWAIFISTPKGQNHFYEVYLMAEGKQDWFRAIFKASETKIIPLAELEAAEAIMSEEEFNQEYECFPKGTLVTTSRGNIDISDIRKGDCVLTHTGRFMPVLEVMSKPYRGELISINRFGYQGETLVTPEHPIRIYSKENQRYSWIEAKDLKSMDYVCSPKKNKGETVLSEDMAVLIAWYICEGSINNNQCFFSLNMGNKQEVDEVKNLLEKIGYVVNIVRGSLCINNTKLCDFLSSVAGNLAENKRIPFELIGGHEDIFFKTMIKGDGHTRIVENKVKYFQYTTISKTLAFDMQILASYLGRRSSIQIRPGGVYNIEGRTGNYVESYSVRINAHNKVNHSRTRDVYPAKFSIAYAIRGIKKEKFSGTVYNLRVKRDESYTANGISVHNCSFTAALVGSYYGKNLAKLESRGRITTVPFDSSLNVITAWDLGIDDSTAIWFIQMYRTEVRVIDYMEGSGEGLEYYIKALSEKEYIYSAHFFPHDIAVRDLITGKSRLEIVKALGLKNVRVAPRLAIADGIQAVRNLLDRCWFDKDNCNQGRIGSQRGLESLRNYQKKWDSKNKIYLSTPKHDWASHGADAFRTLAVVLSDEFADDADDKRRRLPRQCDSDCVPV